MNDTQQITLSKLCEDHKDQVFGLYKRVAAVAGGIARQQHEITPSYVKHFLRNTFDRGCGLVAQIGTRVVGEVHAYAPEPACFSHVLSELTIAVDPEYQSQGVGRLLFEKLLHDVQRKMTHILRVELVVRESNHKAINFYQTLGFVKEGKLRTRIQNADGSHEADIPMAWLRD